MSPTPHQSSTMKAELSPLSWNTQFSSIFLKWYWDMKHSSNSLFHIAFYTPYIVTGELVNLVTAHQMVDLLCDEATMSTILPHQSTHTSWGVCNVTPPLTSQSVFGVGLRMGFISGNLSHPYPHLHTRLPPRAPTIPLAYPLSHTFPHGVICSPMQCRVLFLQIIPNNALFWHFM